MAKKILGKDQFGIQKVMRGSDYFADSMGQFALNAISGMVGQLTYFYTDKVGLAAGMVATVFMVTKIIDAFTDIIMGNIIDHTKPGKERYRPWLLRMAIPAAVLTLMLFTVPAGNSGLQIAYMLLTNLLMTSVVYTAIAIPYASLQVVRTESSEERGKMGVYRALSGYVPGMAIVLAVIPVTNALGGTQSAWIKFAAVVALLVLLCLLFCYKKSKEAAVSDEMAQTLQKEEETEEAVPLLEAVSKLFRNKYWVLALIMGLVSQVTYGLANSSGTYYCKWIYGDDNLVAILGAVGMIPTILGFLLVGPMNKKLGVVKTLRVCFVLGMAANILRVINPTHFWYNTILGCISSFANIPMMCLLGVTTAMAIDYNAFKYGNRMVACSQSATGFGGKVGNGLGASVVGWCLAIAHYDAGLTAATPAVRQAIYAFNIYIPFVLFLVMFVCAMKFDLETRLPQIREELENRKGNRTQN
ncbi:MAG: glycoside-pentoside-hexuronide (GPH):cation symporter [Lachnospiraceae bacterium]|nr:glycoside-pentoside-hexuronide (GPH):cation symporter [Lachnospiraceae bacterium]